MPEQKPRPPENVIYANSLIAFMGTDEVLLDFRRTSPEAPDPDKAEVLVRIIGTREFAEDIVGLLSGLLAKQKKKKNQKSNLSRVGYESTDKSAIFPTNLR